MDNAISINDLTLFVNDRKKVAMLIYAMKLVVIGSVFGMVCCITFILIKMVDEVKKDERKRGMR